jgi:hypothetical protein
MSNDIINFSLQKIQTLQFSLIKENYTKMEAAEINAGLGFGLDKENRMIQVKFNVAYKNDKLPFIIAEVACFFEIAPDSFAGFRVTDEGKTVIPCGLARHLSVLTVGTARGVLHSKTENTEFNSFLLPTINVQELIREDLTF